MQNYDEILQYTATMTLLYVENDPTVGKMTSRLLKEFFSSVIIATDATDALQKYRLHRIDVILTDIVMPRGDAFEMIREIKDDNPDLPVIVLSSYSEKDYFIRAITWGMDAYMAKPFDMEKFFSTLRILLVGSIQPHQHRQELSLLRQYRTVADTSALVSKGDLFGNITYVNDNFCRVSGFEKEELMGKNHNIVRHPDESDTLFEGLWDTIQNKKRSWQGMIKNRKKDGTAYYAKTTITPLFDTLGNVTEYIAMAEDVTELMQRAREFDNAITLLDNPLVVYMKLEDFSDLEDFYDAQTVMHIQTEVKSFLERHMRSAGILYGKLYQLRHGEYAVAFDLSLLNSDIENYLQQLQAFHACIKDSIVFVAEVQYQISLLMSVAYKGYNVVESARIGIKKLRRMKRDFIVANHFYDIEKRNARKNLQTITTIREAIKHNSVVSYFQPIVDNRTREIVRYESLVRLIDREGKVYYPGEFLDVAKKGKYYTHLTQIVLKNSFEALTRHDINVSINLSLSDIKSQQTRTAIVSFLEQYASYAPRITFELLEDEDVRYMKGILRFIDSIKEKGVKIAIDDFGSGYSNYARLLYYRPDILKIDGSLIKNLDKNPYLYSIVKTIVSFARDQNIQTTAEFVETETIYRQVLELGIDYSQGYYFGKSRLL